MTARSQQSRLRSRGLVAGLVVGIALSAVLVWQRTDAVFRASTSNPAGAWSTATLSLADSSTATYMLDRSNLAPGSTYTTCVTVAYTGDVSTQVRLYTAAASGSAALAAALELVIETSPTDSAVADSSCSRSYSWTQTWTGRLSTLNGFSSWAAAAPLSPSWTTTAAPEYRAYRLSYTVKPTADIRSTTATSTLVWEARSI